MKILDLQGRRFGRLVVIRRNGRQGSFKAWDCICDCGSTRNLSSRALLGGHNKSCGCYRREFTIKKNLKHGLAGTPEFRSWSGLRGRCTNPRNAKYLNYGGRGITFCKRWDKFENFLADMGSKPSRAHTIHRIDNDGNYTPANCKWATAKEQGRHKTTSVFITINGVRKCVSEWAEIAGVRDGLIRNRMQRQWPTEFLLAPCTHNGHRMSLRVAKEIAA